MLAYSKVSFPNLLVRCAVDFLKTLYLSKFHFKGLLHCFSTCIEITGNNWYCFNLKNVDNCKEKFQRVKKLQEF